MKFFVNFLSAFRIFASFAIIGTLMSGMYTTTLILFILAALSDFLDGYLARKYNVCTKTGVVLDSVADKFLIINTFILLCIMMPVWFVVIPIIVMIARDLYISGLREFLGTQKISVPHNPVFNGQNKARHANDCGHCIFGIVRIGRIGWRRIKWQIYVICDLRITKHWYIRPLVCIGRIDLVGNAIYNGHHS